MIYNYLLGFPSQLRHRLIVTLNLVFCLPKANKIKKLKNKLIGIVLFGFSFTSVQSQQAVVISGSNILTSSGSVSYSIGQIDYISIGTGVTVSQGMQQAYGKLVELIDSNIRVMVWPNPVFNSLNIKVSDINGTGITSQLFTIDGKLLESRIVKENFLNINMTHYAGATYILVVAHLSKKPISFKIIKN